MNTMQATRRPSFVVFMTDQHQARMLGCAGDPLVLTPNIDAMASGGTRFDRFYVASPSCMPNRAAIFTSRYPSVNGVRVNGIPLPSDSMTFVELMRKDGYKTALIGKAHLQPILEPQDSVRNSLDHHRVEARKAGDDRWWRQELAGNGQWLAPPYYGFDHVDLVTGHGDQCGGHYASWLRSRLPDFMQHIGPANQLPHGYVCPQAIRSRLPEELYPTSYIADRAQAFLRDHAARSPDQPFLLVVSFPDPHHPFSPPGKYWDMYDPEDVTLNVNFDAGDAPAPHLRAAIAERAHGLSKLGGYGAVRLRHQEAREAIALTCGMISHIDDAIGLVRVQLEASGLADRAVQIFTSDHGDLLGDHGLMLKGPLHYQSLIKVACIVNDPRIASQVPKSDALCSSVDLGVSILEMAEVDAHHGVQGISLLPCLVDGSHARDALLIEDEYQSPVLCFDQAPRLRTLVTARYRLTVFADVEWGELYDLQADPGEVCNLWSDANQAQVRAELMQVLTRELIRLADRSPRPRSLA